MAQNWRNDEYSRNDREQDARSDRPEDRAYRSGSDTYGNDSSSGHGRDGGYRNEYGRGGDPSAASRNQPREQGPRGDFSSFDARSSWSGADEGDYRHRSSPYRDYGRGPYEDYGTDPERGSSAGYPTSGSGYGRTAERGYDFSGHGDYGRGGNNRDFARGNGQRPRGRPDWGRQEWGLSGPQQSGGHYDREERGFWDRASDEVSSWFGDEEAERRRHQDQHRGRGPKNYNRSDDRVREDVSDRLSDDGQVDASEVEVSVSKGEVTLAGTVSDRLQRRRAEDIAERVSGVHHVQNNLRVHGTGATPGTQTGITAGQSSTISSKNT